MNTAVLADGLNYYIPSSDLTFFKELAERMRWRIIDTTKKAAQVSSQKSWVDAFAGKWQVTRSTSQILKDIHAARTSNSDIKL